MDIEIFETAGGYGYRVGAVYQEFHPDKEGFQPMTQDEAIACAQQVADRMAQ